MVLYIYFDNEITDEANMMYFIWKNICQNENKLCLTFYLTRDLELGIMSSSRT